MMAFLVIWYVALTYLEAHNAPLNDLFEIHILEPKAAHGC
jgi:hypothetical protein